MKITLKLKKLISVITLACVIMSMLSVVAFAKNKTVASETNEGPYSSYTYWEDMGSAEKTMTYCKPMYDVKTVVDSNSLGTSLFGSVNDVVAEDGKVYLLDSTASTIHVLNSDYSLQKSINKIIYNGEQLSINGASGMFVKNNDIYIADTKNARILVIDLEGNVKNYLTLPDSKLIPDDFNYSPIRVAVDSRDYIYIVSDGSYYGALVYSPKMEFLGFYGANTVAASVGDVIKNLVGKLFTSDAKRAAQVLSLPYQFTDFAIGPNDFIYTVTSTSESDTAVGQVKKLNPGGKDVLGKEDYNFADLSDNLIKAEALNSIDVDSDGFFYVLDNAYYNRVFWYDKECNLMCVFGGGGNTQTQKGTFTLAGALAINGTDVIIADTVNKNLTVFSITEYGKAVRAAQLDTLNDDFSKTKEAWQKIAKLDTNNQLVYRGLAKAYYSEENYDKALEYAKLGADRETYSDAFVKIRTDLLEKYFTLLFVAVILIVAAAWVLIYFKKKKNIKLIKNEKLINLFSCIAHPFESFRLVKEKGLGSVVIATVMLVIYYIVTAVSDVACGFAFNNFDAESYNSFYVLLRTVALVLLFVIANWLVCVLMGGIGKLKEIYIVTCYSLLPTVFAQVVYIIMTHFLSPEEFAFVTIFKFVCIAYTFMILAVGIMKIHDFEFGKFLGTTVVTGIAMLVIVFLIFLVFLLAQQVYGWVITIFTEIKYR